MDVERLRQALDVVQHPDGSLREMTRHNADDWPAAVAVLAEVGRLVVEAREVQWCHAHKSTGVKTSCLYGNTTDCDMVPGRLLVPPKGET